MRSASQGSFLQIDQSTFEHNFAAGAGARCTRMAAKSVLVSGCVFANNRSDGHGGGMYNSVSEMRVVNSVFVGNVAERGGAIGDESSALRLINATLAWNVAQFDAGGLLDVYVTDARTSSVVNSILWGNTSRAAQLDGRAPRGHASASCRAVARPRGLTNLHGRRPAAIAMRIRSSCGRRS